jgi:hypothetical protein
LPLLVKGAVDCLGLADGVEVSYNKVYDTNTDVAAWVEARTEMEAVLISGRLPVKNQETSLSLTTVSPM